MSGNAWRRATGPIGIDITTHAVRVVQLQRRGKSVRLFATGSAVGPGPLGSAELLGDAIREAVRSAGGRGSRCVLSVPTLCAHARNLRLPDLPDRELDQAVRFEAQATLGQGALQHFDAGRVGAGSDTRREVVALSVSETDTDRWLRAVDHAGLKPLAFDAAPAAFARTLEFAGRLDPADPANTAQPTQDNADPAPVTAAILELGPSHAAAHFVQPGRVLFSKSLPALEPDNLDPGPSDPLVREFALCLRYLMVTFRGLHPQHLYAMGDAADREPWLRAIAQQTGLDAQPFCGLGQRLQGAGDAWNCPKAAQWALATGLALRPAKETHAERAA
ncbi:MAG: hypothetical protein AAF288_07690 [Planctomycetota bacterium]